MRTVNVKDITRNVKEMCIEANYCLTDDMDQALKQVVDSESSRKTGLVPASGES